MKEREKFELIDRMRQILPRPSKQEVGKMLQLHDDPVLPIPPVDKYQSTPKFQHDTKVIIFRCIYHQQYGYVWEIYKTNF